MHTSPADDAALKRPILAIRLAATAILLILLSPLPRMVSFSNPSDGVILGRYTTLYFGLLVAYTALNLLWAAFTAWLWLTLNAPQLRRWRSWGAARKGLLLTGFGLFSVAVFGFAYAVQERLIPLPHGMLWPLEIVPLLSYVPACLGLGIVFGPAAGVEDRELTLRLPGWAADLWLVVGLAGWAALWIMALRGGAWAGPGLAGMAIVLGVLVIVPGLLLDRALGLPRRLPAAGRLALWFVLGLTTLQLIALPVRLYGLHVRASLLILAAIETLLLLAAITSRLRQRKGPERQPLVISTDVSTLLFAAAALISVGAVVWAMRQMAGFIYESSADVWAYSEYVSWFVQHPGKAMVSRNVLIGGVDFRYRTNGWLLANATMAWAQGVPPAEQIAITLLILLPLVGLSAVFFLAYQVSDRNLRISLLAVIVTAMSYLLAIIKADGAALEANGAASFFLTRLSEDKSIALFIFTPVLLGLLYVCVRERKNPLLVPVFAFAAMGIVLVHPLGIVAVAAAVGGFGLLHIIASPSRARIGVFVLLTLIVLPLTAVSFVQSGEISIPGLEEAVLARLVRPVELSPPRGPYADLRAVEFDSPPQTTADGDGDADGADQDTGETDVGLRSTVPWEAIGYTPLLAAAVAAAVVLIVLARRQLAVQLLGGMTLVIVVVLYAPTTAAIISRFASPRALETAWRFLWIIPVGTILAVVVQQIAIRFEQKPLPAWQRAARAAVAWAMLAEILTGVILLPSPLEAQVRRDDPFVIAPRDWALLDELEALDTDSDLIFAPRSLSGLITGYGRGFVLSAKAPEKLVDKNRVALEWAEAFFAEDDPDAIAQEREKFTEVVDALGVTMVILPRDHPFNALLTGSPPVPTVLLAETEHYVIYRVGLGVTNP